MRIFSVCLIFLLLSLFSPLSVVYTHSSIDFPQVSDGQINEAIAKTVPVRFLPGNSMHFAISLKESFNRFFRPSSLQKAQFDLVTSGKRLKEAYLLIKKGDVKNSSKSLNEYAKRMRIFERQIKKARSQNQDVASFIGKASDDLKIHEILFSAIWQEFALKEDAYNFDINFSAVLDAFGEVVKALDEIKPGLSDRYNILKKISPSPFPSPSILPSPSVVESTGSVKPRRIIY